MCNMGYYTFYILFGYDKQIQTYWIHIIHKVLYNVMDYVNISFVLRSSISEMN